MLIPDNIGAQIRINRGRIDQVIETDSTIYIFEFKLENAQKAIDQIHEKKYYEKYRHRDKTIVLVGVSFSKQERNINDWIIQPFGEDSTTRYAAQFGGVGFHSPPGEGSAP